VIFAAAMSSFASEINSLASATVIDFYQRYFRREASDKHYLWISRAATLFWGAFATTAACLAGGRLGSLIEAVNKVGSYFYGPILGVFLLAFMVRRANGTGAFWGLLVGEVSVLGVALYSSISWLYYNVVGAAVVLLAGAALSLTRPQRQSPAAAGGGA
jgi:SSS family solute:Na+ symporter